MSFHILRIPADVDAALEASHQQPIVIFKHSSSCPFSAAAQLQICRGKHDMEVYGLVVQYTPELSKLVAEKLGVEHATPQAIVVHKGEAKSHYWRSEIKEAKLLLEVESLVAAG